MRQPGRLTRCRSVITRSMPGPYFRYTRSTPCLSSGVTFKLDEGTSTLGSLARTPFRIRLIMSATGSVMFISVTSPRPCLPAGLDDAGDVPGQRQLAETDAAHLELP